MTGPRRWSPVLDRVKPVRIPSLCFAKHPEMQLHCTKGPHTTGDHFHCYRQIRWTNSGNDPQW
jgi:hypothetical protein